MEPIITGKPSDDDDSDADSDMTDPFAPVTEALPKNEAVRRCPAFWGAKQWKGKLAIQEKERRVRSQRQRIQKWLGPILKEGGLLREGSRIRRSLRLKQMDIICTG